MLGSRRFAADQASDGLVRGIEGAVTREIGWVPDGVWNEWIPPAGGYDGLDFPRRITWGVDSRGVRWLRLATNLGVEFPASASCREAVSSY